MIADCNIKVNGRWIHAGEEYGEPEQKAKAPETEPVKEEPKAEPRTTASRRKKISD